MASTRDRILDALEEELLAHGPAGATLEAVAERAGVSKGGLLYHFRSKDELFGGLLDRLTLEITSSGATRPVGDPVEATRIFLESSQSVEGSDTRTLMAALRLVGTYEPTQDRLARYLDDWAAGLYRDVADPAAARLVQLVGDGLYLHALLGGAGSDLDSDVVALVQRLVTTPPPA